MRRSDSGCDVVVSGSDIGHQRAERIEGRLVTQLAFLLYLHLDLVQRNVARAFNHDLNIVFPGFLGEFA